MKLTKEEEEEYKRATLYARPKELFTVIWWDLFNHNKRDKLHRCIIKGMHWSISYKLAKNYSKTR